MRRRANQERQPSKIRAFRCAVAGIFMQAMEHGEQRLHAMRLRTAIAYFESILVADPDSSCGLSTVGVARAKAGRRKGPFEALRHDHQL